MASITFDLPEERKQAFSNFCQETGLDVSTTLNVFIVATLRQGKIPFEIAADPFYSGRNLQALQESIAEADRGKFAAESTADGFSGLIESL